ncbi:hypothetical protein [Leptolyngbya sp. PCC 6406]|uniref:hypothetical protein n=1 Tax=Leptolyngbya sp. PCC 6406 TaxID=1173264 RepID=UPI0002ACE718|nr:hypothetical protein [Leptolyngbya sp. PCC 6406]
MVDKVWLTIDWRAGDAEVPESVQERLTAGLFREMVGLEGVERVERVADGAMPDGAMGAAWLWGILQAEVTVANAGKVVKGIQARLPGKPISFTVKGAKGGEVKVENIRPEEVDATLAKLVAAAKEL